MSLNEARERYHEARARAQREDWLAHLTGRQDDLLPYEVVAQILQAHEHAARPELRSIPLDRIVGSVGRYRDFTRTFMPREGVSPDRWSRIDLASAGMEGLPPIEVYQIADLYFVADGNHRASVARANGFTEIEACVTTVSLDVPVDLEPGDTLDQIIIKTECARFLTETQLSQGCQELDIEFTKPGGYARLLEHVAVHCYFMTIDRPEAGEPTFQEAAADWYGKVYLPIAAAIHRQGLLERFPGMTAADLYVWISARILELHQLDGQPVSPEVAAALVADENQAQTPFHRTVLSLIYRLADKAAWLVASDSDAGLPLPGLIPEAALGPVPETVLGLLPKKGSAT